MEENKVDLRAAYDVVLALQERLTNELHEAEVGRLDYKAVKALGAAYELQDYLAKAIALAVATGELEADPED